MLGVVGIHPLLEDLPRCERGGRAILSGRRGRRGRRGRGSLRFLRGGTIRGSRNRILGQDQRTNQEHYRNPCQGLRTSVRETSEAIQAAGPEQGGLRIGWIFFH